MKPIAMLMTLLVSAVSFAQGVEKVDLGSIPTPVVVRFRDNSTDGELRRILERFMGPGMENALADVATNEYLFYRNNLRRLWFHPQSGYFSWSDSAVDVPAWTGPQEVGPDDAEKMWVLGETFVRSLGLLSSSEKLTREHARMLTVWYPVEDSQIDAVVPQGYDLTFGRTVLGWPVFGGSYAKVRFCSPSKICGGEVLFRQIESVEYRKMRPQDEVSNSLTAAVLAQTLDFAPLEPDPTFPPMYGIYCRGKGSHQVVGYPVLQVRACDQGSGCLAGAVLWADLVADVPESPKRVVLPWHQAEIDRFVEAPGTENVSPSGCEECK